MLCCTIGTRPRKSAYTAVNYFEAGAAMSQKNSILRPDWLLAPRHSPGPHGRGGRNGPRVVPRHPIKEGLTT